MMLDAAKAKSKNGGWKLPGQKPSDHDGEETSEEARVEIEQAEDEFVGQTEEAVGVMKNVSIVGNSEKLETNPIRSLMPRNHSVTSLI